jgi:hypothetical protein
MGLRGPKPKPKRCPNCGETDVLRFGAHRSRYDGLQVYCQQCHNVKRSKESQRLWMHSWTPERMQAQYDKQLGYCPVCSKLLGDRFVIDHDHTCCPGHKSCGKCTRGLIHYRCNNLLGQARDSVEALQHAIAYLISNNKTK